MKSVVAERMGCPVRCEERVVWVLISGSGASKPEGHLDENRKKDARREGQAPETCPVSSFCPAGDI